MERALGELVIGETVPGETFDAQQVGRDGDAAAWGSPTMVTTAAMLILILRFYRNPREKIIIVRKDLHNKTAPTPRNDVSSPLLLQGFSWRSLWRIDPDGLYRVLGILEREKGRGERENRKNMIFSLFPCTVFFWWGEEGNDSCLG